MTLDAKGFRGLLRGIDWNLGKMGIEMVIGNIYLGQPSLEIRGDYDVNDGQIGILWMVFKLQNVIFFTLIILDSGQVWISIRNIFKNVTCS